MKPRLRLLFAMLVLHISGFGQEQPFHFLILTDTQFGLYSWNKDFVRETANYEFAVSTVNRLKPGFVIILGDLVNQSGDPNQLREFKRITQEIDPAIPVYLLPGNRDLSDPPVLESLEAYRKNIGKDYYSFQTGPVYGIVLNSNLLISPEKLPNDYKKQLLWLKEELERAEKSGVPNIIIFQHHPYFIKEPQEEDSPSNIPMEVRKSILALLHAHNVHYIFAGHTHACSIGKDGDLEMTVTGPISIPFSEDGSGMRLVEVTKEGVHHRYYHFGRLPDKLSLK